MRKIKIVASSVLGLAVILSAGVAAAAELNFGYTVPGFGGYSCTPPETATTAWAPNFQVKVTFASGGGMLNFGKGQGCTENSAGNSGSGGTLETAWFPIGLQEETEFNVNDKAGQSVQLWTASPLDYTTGTQVDGYWWH